MGNIHDDNIELLSAYLDGQLNDDQRAELEEHLRLCNQCQNELDELQATIALVKALPIPRPPRSFTLDPAQFAPKRQPRWLPVLRFTSAALALLLFLSFGVDLFSTAGNLNGSFSAPASAPENAMLRSADSPTTAAAAQPEREALTGAAGRQNDLAHAPESAAGSEPPAAQEEAPDAQSAPAATATAEPQAPLAFQQPTAAAEGAPAEGSDALPPVPGLAASEVLSQNLQDYHEGPTYITTDEAALSMELPVQDTTELKDQALDAATEATVTALTTEEQAAPNLDQKPGAWLSQFQILVGLLLMVSLVSLLYVRRRGL